MEIGSRGEENNQTDKDQVNLGLFRKQTILFHTFMFFTCMLTPVVITSWKYSDLNSVEEVLSPRSELGAKIQLYTSFGAMLMMVWTLVAPKLFPNRQFD